MVTPAARRGAVAHAIKVFAVSQRRAYDVLEVDRSCVRYRDRRPRMPRCEAVFASWRPSAGGLAIGGWVSF